MFVIRIVEFDNAAPRYYVQTNGDGTFDTVDNVRDATTWQDFSAVSLVVMHLRKNDRDGAQIDVVPFGLDSRQSCGSQAIS